MREWIVSRTPPAPSELLEHLLVDATATATATAGLHAPVHADNSALHDSVDGLPEALMTASEGALGRVLSSGAASRDSALDLLSSDAFVTYAFEAAADEPATVVARADAAMKRISARAVRFLAAS